MRLGDVIKWGLIIALFGGPFGLLIGGPMVFLGAVFVAVVFVGYVVFWFFFGLPEQIENLVQHRCKLPSTPLSINTAPFPDRRTLSH